MQSVTSGMETDVGLWLGRKVPFKDSILTVTETDLKVLPRMRDYLIAVAEQHGTVTYGEMKADLHLMHAVNGLGRLLDLLSFDCDKREEPSLAALVVSKRNQEVGDSFAGDAADERALAYARWGT